MPNFSIERQNRTIKVIDSTIKKAVDHIVHKLVDKYDYHMSPATQGEIVNLTINYIKRLNEIISSENLMEPEAFDENTWDTQA